MFKDVFNKVTIITAEKGKFLKIKGNKKSEWLIRRLEKIIFSNTAEVPEIEEADIIRD